MRRYRNYYIIMSNLTVSYSTHRPETLELTAKVMQEHDVIILEEPFHDHFAGVLDGSVALEEHLLELEVGYPEFTLGQYRILQQLHQASKKILQVEPYLEHLINIQYFLADDHSPKEIEPGTIAHAVYLAERAATGRLIDYYKEVQGDNFRQILSTMNSFAKADAARFILRDTLRVTRIQEVLVPGKHTYVEAGSIHLLLLRLLGKGLSQEWHLQVYSADREVTGLLNYKGGLFSPGDELTLSYIWGRKVSRREWELGCAQALIYSKIVSKEESFSGDETFPHARNEIESITAVKDLSVEACSLIFQRIRNLPTEDAVDAVKKYVKESKKLRV